jgi:hypothetical protein
VAFTTGVDEVRIGYIEAAVGLKLHVESKFVVRQADARFGERDVFALTFSLKTFAQFSDELVVGDLFEREVITVIEVVLTHGGRRLAIGV